MLVFDHGHHQISARRRIVRRSVSVAPEFSWSKLTTATFIDFMKANTCLWNIKSAENKNRDMRKVSLNYIIAEFEKLGHNISENIIKNKIYTLRTAITHYYRSYYN